MKQYRIVITSIAENDILIGKNWYNSQHNKLGDEFISEIENKIQVIQSNPYLCSIIKKDIRKALVKRFPFGIYYFVNSDVINIFAVIHFSRNPKTWKHRLK
jgi:hypothetical protein